MTYEQKRESWPKEMNPEIELLQLRIDDIINFVDKKIIDSEDPRISSFFSEENDWREELIEIKSLLDDETVKKSMIEESDYSDVVGNFYSPVFLFLKKIESGKDFKKQPEIVHSVRAKTSDFLFYLKNFARKEKLAA